MGSQLSSEEIANVNRLDLNDLKARIAAERDENYLQARMNDKAHSLQKRDQYRRRLLILKAWKARVKKLEKEVFTAEDQRAMEASVAGTPSAYVLSLLEHVAGEVAEMKAQGETYASKHFGIAVRLQGALKDKLWRLLKERVGDQQVREAFVKFAKEKLGSDANLTVTVAQRCLVRRWSL